MPNWVNIFLGVLTVVTAAGMGLSGTYVSELRKRVTDLRGEIDDKDRRLRLAEADVLAEKAERKILATEVVALQRLVTGDDKLNEIRQLNIKHHDAAVIHWQEQTRLLKRISTSLDKGGRT
jgi:hypothetical protein